MVGIWFDGYIDHTSQEVWQDTQYEYGGMFFSNKYANRGDLFEGLSIWNEKSPDGNYQYRQLQGTFPVLFLSFASIETASCQDMEYKITTVIAKLYEQNNYLLEGNLLSENEKSIIKV